MDLRRRALMAESEEEMKEWQTIVDMVTEEELSGSGNAFIFTTMPDGTPIEGKGLREIAVYYKYNANSDGATSAYIKLQIKGINGGIAAAQPSQGIPDKGYRRGYTRVVLGGLFNLFEVQQSTNTFMQPTGVYDSTSDFIDEVKQIQMLTYANVGAGSELKIMAR